MVNNVAHRQILENRAFETMYEEEYTWQKSSLTLRLVKIRDTAGKRAGYFYGSDNFFANQVPVNGGADTSTSYRAGHAYRYTSDSKYGINTSGSNAYGVYADAVYSDGRIRIRSRYNSTYSLTIDGTYKVEVYLLTPPSAIFA